MESLIYCQEDIFDRISKACKNYKKSPKERLSKEYIEGRLELLEQLWVEFLSGHKELMRSVTSAKLIADTKYIKSDMYNQGQEQYLEYKCELKTALSKINSSDHAIQPAGELQSKPSCNIRLPKANIPSFSGKYTEWNTFRDLFHSLVHSNSDLDDVQRLLYLKGYLTGEAEQLLCNIPITQQNYLRCWKLLEERYNNKRYISHHILKRLMSQKNITHESASGLKELIDTTNDCLSSLTNLGINVESWDILVIHILVLKLDPESKRQWEFTAVEGTSNELPTYKLFQEFITKRYRAIEFLDPGSTSAQRYQRNLPLNRMKSMHIATVQCPFCSEEHKLNVCKSFIKEPVNSRRSFVQSNNICFCCLGSNHVAKNCQINIKCRVCKKKHHALLHPASEGMSKSNVSRTSSTNPSTVKDAKQSSLLPCDDRLESVPVVSCFTRKMNPILLATALVTTLSKTGQRHTIRALLDQGSQSSFITEATVQQLGLKKTPLKSQISGVGGDHGLISKAVVNLKISSRIDPKVIINVKAHVLRSITTLLPTSEVKTVEWKELDEVVLADPNYHTPSRVDMLLGAEVYGQVLQNGVKKGPHGSPVAQSTSLGWILSGAIDGESTTSEIKVMHIIADNNLLKQFWELEDDLPMSKERLQTDDEKRCEEIFATTTTRDDSGRFIVRLPFKGQHPEVANSMKIAERRLISLEKRLNTTDLKERYKEVINEYIQMNHMELVPEDEIDNPKAVYLPHHAVVRDDKETTKIRAVFDASCKGANHVSLNDNLLVGPSLQADLRHLVLRWRMSRICLTADIVKMYRQVKVNEADCDYQRILWRNNPDDEIEHYRMLRVTFGVASAPYLAVKALQQLSIDEKQQYPVASKSVLHQFYMDDLLGGCENIEEGIHFYTEMNNLLAKGGFKLQKWTSNSEELLQEMKENEIMTETDAATEGEIKDGLKIKTDEIVKIVGLTWNRSDDSFHYKVDLSDEIQEPTTKRLIISNICRFYDPLGWVGPSIIVAKIIIQKLWLAGLEWDEAVPSNMLQEWRTYREQLKLLSNVSIPRWIAVKVGDHVELHGFSDASKEAYAAVVYTRVVDPNGRIHVSLIAAKTKVAPIKQVSIPRLELCGAVLLTRLMTELASVLNIEKTHLHAWTDSTVVLGWLNSHPSRWKVFVANRVSEIISNLDSHHWAHVSSKCNPADAASRGQNPSELLKNDMWFKGPEFLHEQNITYKKPKDISTNIEEVTNTKVLCVKVENSIWARFSSLTRMVRVTAYCKRFAFNLKNNSARRIGFLTTQELKEALNACIRRSQSEGFSEELALVKNNKNLPKRSKLRVLNPILDDEMVLRVGGRLEHSALSKQRKHPILIPKESHLADLLVSDAHKQTLHGGPQLMLCYLRNKYWIPGAGRLVKSCFRNCVICVKNTGNTQTQLMGQLPSARSTPARPFKTSGVDYAGPIQIRTAKGRGHKSHKAYICLFVCVVTRAIHLDVVTDLTTEGFLQAFKRFVARRGYCSEIWSDNGTNFTGAASELKRLFHYEKSSMHQELAEALATNGCSWNFIPSRAPNFGGLWEAGVKSVKYHLKRLIGQSTLTFEEMSTVLAQIEACLNSRPLSVMTGNDDEDEVILTPGHFLVGEALVALPDTNFESSNVTSLRRWQYTQRMTQDFWRQWSKQYLTRFYKRYRWSDQMPQPRIGDVVVVREDNLPVCRWLYGKVIATHPGQDNLIRVVTLKVKNGTIKRPVNKLCLLPVTT